MKLPGTAAGKGSRPGGRICTVNNTKKRPATKPAEIFTGGSKLDDLASLANAAHAACEQAVRSALTHARDCGETLIEAKRLVGHGNWLPWVAKYCRFSERQARNYVTIARGWKRLTRTAGDGQFIFAANRQRVADLTLEHLSIREALRILAAEQVTIRKTNEKTTIFGDGKCPSCGEPLVKTSSQWQTCVECPDCKLYGNPERRSIYAKETPGIFTLFAAWKNTGPADRAFFLKEVHALEILEGPYKDSEPEWGMGRDAL